MLSEKQVRVLARLGEGLSITDTARIERVSRNTVYRWINDKPAVRAAYNRWKRVCAQSAEARLVALQDKAIDVLVDAMECGNDARLAAMLLTKMGVLKPPDMGATTCEEAQREIEAEQMAERAEVARVEAEAREALGGSGGGGDWRRGELSGRRRRKGSGGRDCRFKAHNKMPSARRFQQDVMIASSSKNAFCQEARGCRYGLAQRTRTTQRTRRGRRENW